MWRACLAASSAHDASAKFVGAYIFLQCWRTFDDICSLSFVAFCVTSAIYSGPQHIPTNKNKREG